MRANPKFPLLEGMKQLNVLKELDLSGNDLSQFQNDLQVSACQPVISKLTSYFVYSSGVSLSYKLSNLTKPS